MPCNLLVEDDIVLLACGDKAPSEVKYIHADGSQYILKRHQLLQPSFFSSLIPQKTTGTNGLYYFKVMETPLRKIIESSLKSNRPETMIALQFRLLENLVINYGLWLVLGISLLINIIRLLVIFENGDERINNGYQLFVHLQFYTLLPILPISFPIFLAIIRSYGNAQILSLFDALQCSKNEFQDKEDVDEFDAAPAPTKDVRVSWGKRIFYFR